MKHKPFLLALFICLSLPSCNEVTGANTKEVLFETPDGQHKIVRISFDVELNSILQKTRFDILKGTIKGIPFEGDKVECRFTYGNIPIDDGDISLPQQVCFNENKSIIVVKGKIRSHFEKSTSKKCANSVILLEFYRLLKGTNKQREKVGTLTFEGQLCQTPSNLNPEDCRGLGLGFNKQDVTVPCGKVYLGMTTLVDTDWIEVTHYFLQFIGPVTKEQKDALWASGAKVVGSAGHGVYLIEVELPIFRHVRQINDRIQNIPGVGGSAPYLPQHKIAPYITEDDHEFIALLFRPWSDDHINPDVLKNVKQALSDILQLDSDNEDNIRGSGRRLVFTLKDQTLLRKIASISNIQYIEPRKKITLW